MCGAIRNAGERRESLRGRHSDSLPADISAVNAPKVDPLPESAQPGGVFKIRTSDLDINLHTNNVSYIRWVIDSYNLDFVMNKLPVSVEINYMSESVCGEEVFIRTFVDKSNSNLFSHSVNRKNDNKELCRMKIEWKNNSK